MLDLHNVRMTKKPKKLNLTKNSRGIRNVFEDIIYLFYRNLLPEMSVVCRADDAIATFADYFLDSISISFAIFGEEIYIRCLKLNNNMPYSTYKVINTQPFKISASSLFLTL